MNCRYLKLVLIILDEFGIPIVQDECEIHEESSNYATNFLLTLYFWNEKNAYPENR